MADETGKPESAVFDGVGCTAGGVGAVRCRNLTDCLQGAYVPKSERF